MGNFAKDDVFGGRYKLTRKLGIGGFSEVWQAEDEMTEGTVVAVKIYAPEKGLDEYGLKQFRREYSLTQPLNHPNLLKASYFDIADGSPFLVMPYCSKGSVGNKLMEHQVLGEKEIAQILAQVGDGLSYLHSKDIVHQDIKPDNILIDNDNNYLLTDFGISSRMRSTLRKATTMSGALTVAYAPPERFDQNPQNTTAGDVFSMGVMLYELCEGDVPWMGSGGVSLLSGSKPPLISDKFSPELAKLIQACLSLRMQNRPSAAELASSARAYLTTGKWDISFVKDDSAAQDDAPAFASSGRQTERLDSIPSISAIDTPNNSRNVAEPTSAPPASKPIDPNATRADFSPTATKRKSKTPLIAAIVVVVLLLAGAGGYFFIQQQKAADLKAQYDTSINKANTALAGDKYADAKEAYLAALEIYPDDAIAKSGLESVEEKIKEKYTAAYDEGNKLLEEKKYGDAIAKYELALTFIPDDKEATDKAAEAKYFIELDKGDNYLAAKDYENARMAYENALSFKAGDEVAQGKFDEASRQEKAIKLAAVNAQLIAGVKNGSAAEVSAALKAGADPSAHDGKTPVLFLAVKNGNLQLVKDLVSAGAKCTDKSGNLVIGSASYGSPSVLAAGMGKLDILKYFIESCNVPVNDQEYDSSTKSNDGWSPLGAAASAGKLDVVKYMVGKGANKNIRQGSYKLTPVLEAASNGHYDVVKYLIDNKADVTITASNGRDAYDLAKTTSIKSLLKENGLGKVTYIDNFSSYSSSYFFPDKKKFSDSNREIYIANGKLVYYLSKDIGSSYTQDFDDLNSMEDYTVEAEFSISGTTDPHGLVFGGKGSGDSYRVLLDTDGGYLALKKYGGGDWKTIVEYSKSSAINTRSGQSNTIKVEKKGSSVNVYVNGTKLISNQNLPRIAGTTFGFFCQTIYTKVTVDNFKLVGARK